MNSVKHNAVVNAILSVANIIFPLITFPYVSRVLLVEANGQLSFVSSVVNYFSLFATLGLSTYGIKACARVKDDRKKLSKTVQELIMINAVTTLIATLALIFAVASIPKFRDEWLLFFIYSWGMILNVVGLNWLYTAMEDYDYITTRSIAFKCIGIILMLIFVHSPDDCYKYAAITIFSTVGGNILNIIHSKKYIDFKPVGNYKPRKHLMPTLAMFSTYLAVNVYSSLDNVMLGIIYNNYEVGIYAAAVKIRTVLTTLITSLGNVLLPRLSYYVAQERWEEFRVLLKKTYKTIIMIAIPMMVYFMLAAKQSIIFISGDAYLDAVRPMCILMPIMLISSLSNITGMQILIPTGGEWKFAISVTIGAVVDLILNMIFIPQYGATGAAIGTLFAELSQFAMQLYFTKNYLKDVVEVQDTFKVSFATLLSCIGFFLIYRWIQIGAFFFLLLSSCIFFGIYAVILYVLKYDIFIEICDIMKKPFAKIPHNNRNRDNRSSREKTRK